MSEDRPPRYAIIATYNRPKVALDCINSVVKQVDTIFVIDNGDEIPMPPASDEHILTPYYVAHVDMQPVNLSRLWNMGLDLVRRDAYDRMGCDEWDVAILNDDAIVPEGWFDLVSNHMRSEGAAAGCTGSFTVTHRKAQPVGLHARMTGWAFMLRGEAGLLLDEFMAWWFADDDLGWRAAEAGGMAMVQGAQPHNRFPNGNMTPEKHEQAAKDAATFKAKWGVMPW